MGYRVIHTSTVTAYAARGVRCAHCGEDYLYDVRRDAAESETSSTHTDSGAAYRASERAHQEVQLQLQTAIDLVPCPTCGAYQPDMVAYLKRKYLRWMLWLGVPALLASFVLGGLLVGRDYNPENMPVVAAALAGLGGVLLVLRGVLAARYDPNAGDREQCQELGSARAYRPIDANRLALDRQRRPAATSPWEVGSALLNAARFWWVVGVGVLIAGGTAGFRAGDQMLDAADSRTWPTAKGRMVVSYYDVRRTPEKKTILSSTPVSSTTTLVRYRVTPASETVYADIRYSFTLDGRTYTSSNLWFGPSSATEDTVRRFPRDAEVWVYYKPGAPSVSVLEPGLKCPHGYVHAGIAVGIVLLGFGMFCCGMRKYRRHQQLKEPWHTGRPTWRETAPVPVVGQPVILS